MQIMLLCLRYVLSLDRFKFEELGIVNVEWVLLGRQDVGDYFFREHLVDGRSETKV